MPYLAVDNSFTLLAAVLFQVVIFFLRVFL